MPELVWLELARADVLAIVDYISDDNPDAAQRIKDDINAKAEKLSDFPRMRRSGRVERTRELVALTSYIPAYEEDAFTIRILRALLLRSIGNHPLVPVALFYDLLQLSFPLGDRCVQALSKINGTCCVNPRLQDILDFHI